MLRYRDTHIKFSLVVASLIALGVIAYFSLGFLQPEETSVNGYQILLNRGTDAIDIGKYDEALNYYNQAIVIAREVGDRAGEGVSLACIGFVYEAKGQHDQALEYFNQALVIAHELKLFSLEKALLDAINNLPKSP